MAECYYIHVDSKNRDTNVYPNGNNYVLHIPVPIKGVVKADLVSAKIPNSMYNVTNGTGVITTLTKGTINIPQGFYSVDDITKEFTDGIFQYLRAEGKFIFLSNDPSDYVTVNTQEISKILGFTINSTHTVSLLAEPICGYNYGVKSDRVVDLSLNEYVFLDIEEFRTSYFVDAKSMPLSGVNARSMFAAIPMDVASSQIKTFKENTDYQVGMNVPRQNLSRLTVRWYDKNLQPLNFQGYENNSFILRVYSDIVVGSGKEEENHDDERRLIDSYIQEIKRRIDESNNETTKKQEKLPSIGKWAVVVVIIGILFYFYTSKKSV